MEEARSNDNVIIHICKVLGYSDPYESKRIKVRFPYVDNGKSDEDLPWCSPLMPKLIHIAPKEGEAVLVFMEKDGARDDNRFYIGPFISQQYFNNFDPFISTALSGLTDAKLKMLQAPSKNPNNEGVLPDDDDVAIMGRENTDVILKPQEIQIRCGIKQNPNSSNMSARLEANMVDPAYIQMIYNKNSFYDNSNSRLDERKYNSVVNIVADRVNLLSKTSKEPYNLYSKLLLDRDNDDGRTKNDEIESIVNSAHPLVYGDELIDYLKELVEMFITHTHPFPMCPPSISGPMQTFISKDTNDMLSKSIKIN